MVTLTDPTSAQNTIDRFADYVVATANAGIVFGTNALPFGAYSAYFPAIFGGTTSGKAIGVTGTNLGGSGSIMTASTVYTTLVAETNTYTRIRNLRARLFITGLGYAPAPGTDFTVNLMTDAGPIFGVPPGYAYDETSVANLNTTYNQDVGAITSRAIATGHTISTTNLEAFYTNLRTAYETTRANTVSIQVDVCHSSCHNNCHSSRGRR
jgi:hypothetical protein